MPVVPAVPAFEPSAVPIADLFQREHFQPVNDLPGAFALYLDKLPLPSGVLRSCSAVCCQLHVPASGIFCTFLRHCRRSLSHACQHTPPHRNINAVLVSRGIGHIRSAVRQISHRHAYGILITERSGGHLHIRPVTGLQESSLRGVRRGADQIPHGSQCFPVSGFQHLLHACVLPNVHRNFSGSLVGVVVDVHRLHAGIFK